MYLINFNLLGSIVLGKGSYFYFIQGIDFFSISSNLIPFYTPFSHKKCFLDNFVNLAYIFEDY